MTLPIIQVTVVAAVSIYLVRCRAQIVRRNRQSWDLLLARLSPAWSACVVDPTLPAEAARLYTIYRDARVMQEIAYYALSKLPPSDRALAASLHRDATAARYRAVLALVRYGLNKPPKPSA